MINNVSHDEALDGLILRNAATAVVASDVVDVAATVLRSAGVSSLLGHRKLRDNNKHTVPHVIY